jgi:Putative zinc-finger
MSMTCDRIEEQLSRYRDGAMDRLGEWRVRRHLRRCPRCTAAADDAAELDFAMRLALVEAEPPSYLAGAVMRRLPAMPPARPSAWLPARGRSVRWLVGLGCAAAQIAGLCGAYRLGYTRAEQRRPAARPALRGTFAVEHLGIARAATAADEPILRRRAAAVPLAAQPVR